MAEVTSGLSGISFAPTVDYATANRNALSNIGAQQALTDAQTARTLAPQVAAGDPTATAQAIAADPVRGLQTVQGLSLANASHREQIQQQLGLTSSVAGSIVGLPPDQQAQAYTALRPGLLAAGVPAEVLPEQYPGAAVMVAHRNAAIPALESLKLQANVPTTNPVSPLQYGLPNAGGGGSTAAPSPGGPAPSAGASVSGSFVSRLGQVESGNNPTEVNPNGYAGTYQFGTARLADLGMYTPAPNENLSANQWTGTLNIPGYPNVHRLADFTASPGAQQAALGAHVADIDTAIASTPGTAGLSTNGLRAVAHLGGVPGMQKFVATGGRYNPADRNGTSLASYYQRFSGGPDDAPVAPPAPTQTAAGPVPVSASPLPPLSGVNVPAPVQVASAASTNGAPAVASDVSSISAAPAVTSGDALINDTIAKLRAGQPTANSTPYPPQNALSRVGQPATAAPVPVPPGGAPQPGLDPDQAAARQRYNARMAATTSQPPNALSMVGRAVPTPPISTAAMNSDVNSRPVTAPIPDAVPPSGQNSLASLSSSPGAGPPSASQQNALSNIGQPAPGSPGAPAIPPVGGQVQPPSQPVNPQQPAGQSQGVPTLQPGEKPYYVGANYETVPGLPGYVYTNRNGQKVPVRLPGAPGAGADVKFVGGHMIATDKQSGSLISDTPGFPDSGRMQIVAGPNGNVVYQSGRPVGTIPFSTQAPQVAIYEQDAKQAGAVAQASAAAEQQIQQAIEGRNLAAGLPTGAGGEDRAELANWLKTYAPASVYNAALASNFIPDAPQSQEAMKIFLRQAGQDEQALGGSGGLGLTERYAKANPTLNMTPQAISDISNLKAITAQAAKDHNDGYLAFFNQQQDNLLHNGKPYQPASNFDQQWYSQKNVGTYLAATNAMNGKPYAEWSRGLSPQDQDRALGIIGRVDPTSVVNGPQGRIGVVKAAPGQAGAGGAPSPGGGAAPQGAPAVGTVMQGYRYQGGDPGNPASWARAQ